VDVNVGKKVAKVMCCGRLLSTWAAHESHNLCVV